MATPLLKRLKQRGTSFYAFPSYSIDSNLASSNDHYKLNFTKFALLNIPTQVVVPYDQTKGKLNFDKSETGPNFFNFQPGGNSDRPTLFGDQLVESLRNYVTNYDTTLRESRINSNTDFYNINEMTTPTEMIFFKWCKKLNIIDFEPALHKIDWDKNLSDFVNKNGSSYDYFQKYLWKERDVNYYSCTIEDGSYNNINVPKLTISGYTKFKVGDSILLSGNTGHILSANTSYTITSITQPTTEPFETVITLDVSGYVSGNAYNCLVYLNYQRLIEYIGEVQVQSKIQTSKKNYTEVTAHIPHQNGKTPTILFDLESNTNYYPGLEMPILPVEQQEEIVGAENTNSPIRLKPIDYPGTYFGYFDTKDKTYMCENGDKIRYSGDYYGINLTNNIGLNSETYFEKLTDFNSDKIDGLKLDMNRNHYLKMNLPNQLIRNFDEFNSSYFDGVPQDFEFNAILWYYELDDSSGNITTNLCGIEFLNNPSDDNDDCDPNYKNISTYKKYVSNGAQDGVSYTFGLNMNTTIDNDMLPLSYDPTTTYNQFGFDLYQNILQSNSQIQENLVTIISGFTYINQDLFQLRSLIYSQTDIDTIKNQISNLNDLLQLYSTFQFIDSDTTSITTNFNGVYPTLQVNTINTKYSDIVDINVSDILYYNNTNSGVSFNIPIPTSNQLLLNIYNDNNDFNENAKIIFNKDMSYKQDMDIFIRPNMSTKNQTLNISMMYNNGSGTIKETSLINNVILPIDLISYNTLVPSASTYSNSYYTNTNVNIYGDSIVSGASSTIINVTENLFETNDYIYIDNFYLQNGSVVTDYSGVYQISATTTNTITIKLPSIGLTMRSKPKMSYYKGLKINILRVDSSTTSSITNRYKITKEII